MNIPRGKCSYCGEDFLNCNCPQFHPIEKEDFTLDDEEIKALLEYFIERAGYISYEHDMKVHSIIKRLQDYEKETNSSKIV